MKSNSNQEEVKWNLDLRNEIKKHLIIDFKSIEVEKTKILKDLFLARNEKNKYSLQLGFVDQDIVIYDETLDISNYPENINFLGSKRESKLIIPKIICELKYNGITSHGLIIY